MKGTRLAFALIALANMLAVAPRSSAQKPDDEPAGEPGPKSVRDLIKKQDPPIVTRELADKITPDNSRIVVNLALQRATLMVGDAVYIDTPVSTGKLTGPTPVGKFTILEKENERRASIYGDFIDGAKNVISSGVSMKVDAAPGGTRFVPVPMRYFCRFNDSGFGFHAGILPGYPAAHGCVRLPEDVARVFFEKVKVGTPVQIVAE